MTSVELVTPVLWVGVIQLAAWEAGERLHAGLTRGAGPAATGAVRASLSALLGLVVFANAALLLAFLHLLYAPAVVAAVIALAALGGRRLVRSRPWRGWRPSLEDLPLALAVAFVCLHLPNALYPVLDHDDNVYHLFLPRHYLESHAFDAPIFGLYGAMPHLIEVLYAIPLALGDFVAGKLLAFSIHFWILAGLGGCVRPRLGRIGVGVLALLYVSGQNVASHFGRAYNEPILGFFLLGAALAFVVWWDTRRGAYLAIAGIACGAACASKYTAWLYVAAIFAAWGLAILRLEPEPRGRLRAASLLVIPCAALVLPWLLQGLWRTGNPVYPNLVGSLGGPYWSETQAFHHWRMLGVSGGVHRDFMSTLLLPFRLVSDGRAFLAPTFSGSLMLVFLVGLVHPKSYRGAGVFLQLMAVAGFLAWASTVQGGRYLVALVPLVTLAAGFWLPRGRWLVAIVVLTLGIAIAQRTLQPAAEVPATDVFTHSREELLARNANWGLTQFLNQELPADAKLLGLWENRFFFLERPFEADPLYEAPSGLAWLRKRDDPEAFARELAARGFTHVVVNPGAMKVYLSNTLPFSLLDDRVYPLRQLVRDNQLWNAFSQRYLEPMPWPGPTLVYRLRPL